MKLEVGKRYVLRNGEVTNSLRQHDEKLFTDGVDRWNVRGYCCFDEEECDHDIISEYSKPDPSHDVQQPLRWVENCKPDKPGIWAGRDANGETYVTLIDQCNMAARVARWICKAACYLGPIPEILPPKKKVVERLWLEAVANGIEPQTVLHRTHWCVDDHAKAYPINWIRTDETREVER